VEKKRITDTKFWSLYTLAGNGIMVNLMFLICSLPIVTMGPAWCGLYSSLRFAIRGESWATGFKEGIRTRFWRMLVAWTVMLVVILDMVVRILYVIDDIKNGVTTTGSTIPMIIACSAFLLIAVMFTAALILLNVYIPTSVLQWLKNGITLTFTSPIQMAIVGILMWLPLAAYLYFGFDSFLLVMVFIALYFTVVVLIATMLMKNALIRVKQQMEELEQADLEEDAAEEEETPDED